MLLALLLLYSASQLSQEEIWATAVNLHALDSALYYKAPVDAALIVKEEVQFEGLIPSVVNADAPSSMVPVQLVTWQQPPAPITLTGVWSTFSPQFLIGKTTYSWVVDTCNYTQAVQTYDGAIVSQVGAIVGKFSRISAAEAENDMSSQRNKTLPIEGADALSQAGHWLTIIGAAGVFAVSPHGIAVMALATKLSEDFSGWLAKKSPASFLQRFPATSWLQGPMVLPPRGCIQDKILFSRRMKGAHTFSASLP